MKFRKYFTSLNELPVKGSKWRRYFAPTALGEWVIEFRVFFFTLESRIFGSNSNKRQMSFWNTIALKDGIPIRLFVSFVQCSFQSYIQPSNIGTHKPMDFDGNSIIYSTSLKKKHQFNNVNIVMGMYTAETFKSFKKLCNWLAENPLEY